MCENDLLDEIKKYQFYAVELNLYLDNFPNNKKATNAQTTEVKAESADEVKAEKKTESEKDIPVIKDDEKTKYKKKDDN